MTLGMVRDLGVLGFMLDVGGGAHKAGEEGKEQEDIIKGIKDVDVEGWLE
jgi:hypothetical protein